MIKNQLLEELNQVPDELLTEIFHYTVYLKSKHMHTLETPILSQIALGQEWLLPEEDTAWESL